MSSAMQTLAGRSLARDGSRSPGPLTQRPSLLAPPRRVPSSEGRLPAGAKQLQGKLTVGASHDPMEREAERVADSIMTAPTVADVSAGARQIRCFAGRSNASGGEAPASVHQVLSAAGRPMETALRLDMEQRFGHDFSRVRVHAGQAAAQSARDINADAYTVGHDIVFGDGQFSATTVNGRRLIAHELTHVVQQSGMGETDIGQRSAQYRPPAISPAGTVLARQVSGATPDAGVPGAGVPDAGPPPASSTFYRK